MINKFLFLSRNSSIVGLRINKLSKRQNRLCSSGIDTCSVLQDIPEPQEHKLWIKETFDNQILHKLFTHPEQFAEAIKFPISIPGCLINNPENTLAIPLVDFNPDFVVDQLIKSSKRIPSDRIKPVGAIVKGSGGGKTRAFEEVRRRLLVKDKVLVVGITFNNKWCYDDSLENWSKVTSKEPSLSYALSVISRMASVVFNKGFRETVYLIKNKIDSLPEYYRINPDVFLRQFSSYLVERVSVYREIDTFIMLIDEVMKLEIGLSKKFPEYSTEKDFTSVLRTALLNKYISIDKKVNSTLAISSLSFEPIGENTISGRESIVLRLPDRLNSLEIVNKVFGLSNCSDEEKFLMENIASTVNTTPRLVESIREYITDQKVLQNKDIPLINKLFVKNLFEDCSEKIDSRYKTENVALNNKILSAIVYGDDLELKDKDALFAISRSIISNSLKSFNEEDKTPKVITSMLMLWRVTQSEKYDENSLGGFIHRGISEIIGKIIDFKKEGDLLETVLYEWMKIRIVAAMSYDQSSIFNLVRLLGLNNSLIPEKYKKIFNNPINIFMKNSNNFVVDIVGSSYDNMEEMNNIIMNIKVSASKPIVVVRLINNSQTGQEEPFDLIVIVYNNNQDSKYPFYIFLNIKSQQEGLFFQNRPIVKINDILNERSQYIQTKIMMKLNNREFMYIYFKTHNIHSDFEENENNVIVELSRKDSQNFFGPFRFYL